MNDLVNDRSFLVDKKKITKEDDFTQAYNNRDKSLRIINNF